LRLNLKFLPRLHLEKEDVEVIDLVLTSALASQIKRDDTLYDFLGVEDHADYESGIYSFIRPSGGPGWLKVCHILGLSDTIEHRI
jgi:hypothetical protein